MTTRPKDPDAGLQWHLPQLDAKALWDGWPDGAEVTVAVIDSGVDATHGDLEPNVAGGGLACHRRDYSGHGTHVAGIAGAVAENGIAVAGIAPRAKILSIKMPLLNVPPDPDCAQDITSLAQAIKVAVESGADVINMSLGRGVVLGVPHHAGRGDPSGHHERGGAGGRGG